jgi:hypothetical protein
VAIEITGKPVVAKLDREAALKQTYRGKCSYCETKVIGLGSDGAMVLTTGTRDSYTLVIACPSCERSIYCF